MYSRSTRTRTVAAVAVLGLGLPAVVGAAAFATPAKTVKAKNTPAYSINVGSNPADVVVSQALGQAFVANDGSVSVISLLTHREIAEVNSGGGHGQDAIALMQNNTQAYITNSQTDKVNVLDTETRKVKRQITVGWGAQDVATVNAPFGQRAYVAVMPTNQLAVIRTDKGTVTRKVHLPTGPQTVTAGPGGKTVWAGSVDVPAIYVVRTNKPKVIKTIKLPKTGPVNSIVFSPSGKTAWAAGPGGISKINVKTGKQTKFIPILKIFTKAKAPNMGPIALNKSGTKLLVTNSTFPDAPRLGTVHALNTKTYKVGPAITTGHEPIGLAVDKVRGTAYTANYADDTVSYFSFK